MLAWKKLPGNTKTWKYCSTVVLLTTPPPRHSWTNHTPNIILKLNSKCLSSGGRGIWCEEVIAKSNATEISPLEQFRTTATYKRWLLSRYILCSPFLYNVRRTNSHPEVLKVTESLNVYNFVSYRPDLVPSVSVIIFQCLHICQYQSGMSILSIAVPSENCISFPTELFLFLSRIVSSPRLMCFILLCTRVFLLFS